MVQIIFWLLSFVLIIFIGLLGFRSFVGNTASGKHQTYDNRLAGRSLLKLLDKETLNKFAVYGGALTLLLLTVLLVVGILFFGAH